MKDTPKLTLREFADLFFALAALSKPTPQTPQESFFLMFQKKQIIKCRIMGTTMIYKRWNGKLFVLQHYHND